MAEFDWEHGYSDLLRMADARLSSGHLVPTFDRDGVAHGSLLLDLGGAPSAVWADLLAIDEPFWLFERAGDPVTRFVAINIGLGSLILPDGEAFQVLSALADSATGDDIAEEIRWRMADVRDRLLADLRPVLDRLHPGDISSSSTLEWELLVAFVTCHWSRMRLLLACHHGIAGLRPGACNLLAGRLLFHSLTPKVGELEPGPPAKLSRLWTACWVLQLANEPSLEAQLRTMPSEVMIELIPWGHSESQVVTSEEDLCLSDRREWLHLASRCRVGGDVEDASAEFREACDAERSASLELATEAQDRLTVAKAGGLASAADVDALAWVKFVIAVRGGGGGSDTQDIFRSAEDCLVAGARLGARTTSLASSWHSWTWLSDELRVRYRVAALRGARESTAAIDLLQSELGRLRACGREGDQELYEILAQVSDERGDDGDDRNSTDALVRAIEVKPDGDRSWRERLIVLARTQPLEAQFNESLRSAPLLERKVAWQQAKVTHPGIEALTGNAQEHVKDAIIAGSLPTLRRRVVLAQWALALEHELIKRVFEPFRAAHSQAGPPSEGRWTLSRWLVGATQYTPSLGDMSTCLADKWRDPSHQDLHGWVQGRFYARNKANHP